MGPGIRGLPGRSRRQGLFGPPGNDALEQLEFGYCFDVRLLGRRKRQTTLADTYPGLNTRLLPCMGVFIRDPVPAHARHCARLLALTLCRQLVVSGGVRLLLCDIFLGLQRYV